MSEATNLSILLTVFFNKKLQYSMALIFHTSTEWQKSKNREVLPYCREVRICSYLIFFRQIRCSIHSETFAEKLHDVEFK